MSTASALPLILIVSIGSLGVAWLLARWVLAKMRAQQPKVPISTCWSHDTRAYWFQRTSRA